MRLTSCHSSEKHVRQGGIPPTPSHHSAVLYPEMVGSNSRRSSQLALDTSGNMAISKQARGTIELRTIVAICRHINAHVLSCVLDEELTDEFDMFAQDVHCESRARCSTLRCIWCNWAHPIPQMPTTFHMFLVVVCKLRFASLILKAFLHRS